MTRRDPEPRNFLHTPHDAPREGWGGLSADIVGWLLIAAIFIIVWNLLP